jgi:hypothetical protein
LSEREFIKIEKWDEEYRLIERGCGCCETSYYLGISKDNEKRLEDLKALKKFMKYLMEQMELAMKATDELFSEIEGIKGGEA